MNLRVLSFGLAAVIVVLDRLSKLWIEANVEMWERFPVIPGFFDITHTKNRGMAFGLFSDSESPWRTVLLVGVAGVVLVIVGVTIWRQRPEPGWMRVNPVALGLILGGAVGNLYDRAVRGTVTDFIDWYVSGYHWPTFNVADSAITIGAILMALAMIKSPPSEKKV